MWELGGSTSSSRAHRGGERNADAAHGAARLVATALPTVTSASEVVSAAQIQPLGLRVLWRRPCHGRCRPWGRRLGRPMDLGTHGSVCSLATEVWRLVDLEMKVINRSAPRRICGAQHTDPVTQVDGPVMTEVLLRLVSAVSGCGR
jgi:hypothetical protein